MNELQQNLFQLLVEFDEICKNNDIEYLLAAGASLGAIRNRCFMPWDDDIDLYITRDNWNKLRHLVETKDNILPEGRSLVYKENTPYYCNPLPRYVDNTTTTMYVSQALAGKACGQHLELFIMDPMPKGEKEKEDYIKLSRVYAELLTPYFVSNKNTSLEEWKEHYKLYKHYCNRIDKEGEEKVIKELENKLHNLSEEECDTYCMRWGIKVYKYNKKNLQQSEYAIFEGKEFPVGTKPEGILRVAYGDSWMYVPETEEQVSHNSIQSSTRPFNEYTKRYMKKINRESVFKKFKKNKRNNASVFYYRRKFDMLVAKEKVIVKSKNINKDLEDEEYLYSLLKNKEYNKLNEKFKDYYKLQMDRNVRRYNIFVPISDKNIETLLKSLIEQGRYYDANKFLNIYKNHIKQLKELEEVEKEIELCRELSIERYDNKDYNKVQSLINEYEKIYPNLLDIYRGRIWIKENKAETKEDYESIDKLCEEALKLYPFDGEIIATQAKAKYECGQKEEAEKLYINSINKTRNGLIWQKVEDETGISRIEIERDLINGIENKYIIPQKYKNSNNDNKNKTNKNKTNKNKTNKNKTNKNKTQKDIELELLKELDEICETNNLKYILTGANSLNIYNNNEFENNDQIIEVAMTQGDIERFCKIIENQNNKTRYVEGIFNNTNYTNIYTSYGNENTTKFDAISLKDIKHGISINIHPIIKTTINGNPIRLSSKLLKEKKIRDLINKKIESKKLFFLKLGINSLNKIYKSINGKNNYYNKIKKYTFIDKWEDIQNYSKIIINNKIINAKSLKDTKKLELNGINVVLPKDTDTYFKDMFGKDYKNIIIKEEKNKNIILDTENSYKKIIKETENILKEIKITHEKILLKRLKLIKDKDSTYNVWYIVEMTDKQIKFIEYFEENKESLLNLDLNNEEEYKKLQWKLKPIIKTLNEYSKLGMTFSISPEADQLIEKVLLKQGNEKLVKKLKKLREKEYFIE